MTDTPENKKISRDLFKELHKFKRIGPARDGDIDYSELEKYIEKLVEEET